jgi:hypothetical protein
MFGRGYQSSHAHTKPPHKINYYGKKQGHPNAPGDCPHRELCPGSDARGRDSDDLVSPPEALRVGPLHPETVAYNRAVCFETLIRAVRGHRVQTIALPPGSLYAGVLPKPPEMIFNWRLHEQNLHRKASCCGNPEAA